ncbi:hypothetical protein K4F52_003267 [Lecanicillium sp. MT-2017a]|nr:hypothetical protein K4F52_003267 [Lecanicillium sp. MT-2017a]
MLSRSAFTLGLIMSLVSHAAVFAAPFDSTRSKLTQKMDGGGANYVPEIQAAKDAATALRS